MEKLTKKEEEIMQYFWEKESLFVKDLLDFLPEPKPHVNTISTIVRTLEAKGYLDHRQFGSTYQYFAIIPKQDFSKSRLKNVVSKYFKNSYLSAVSSLVKDEQISIDQLKALVEDLEKQQSKK